MGSKDFFEFQTPEGGAIIKISAVVAISESRSVGLGCLIWTGVGSEDHFNCTEKYSDVVARFSNVATK